MKKLHSAAAAGWAWRGALDLLLKPAIWLPFLVVGGLEVALLLALAGFHHPVLLPFALPLVKFLAGESATHYPVLYYALPVMFSKLDSTVVPLLSAIAGGAATLLFADVFGMRMKTEAWSRAIRTAPRLIGVTLPVLILLLGIGELVKLLPRGLIREDRVIRWGLRASLVSLTIVIESFMAYTTAWITLMGHGVWPAIRDSIRVTRMTFLPTLIVVGTPILLIYPLHYASMRVDFIAGKFRPEVIGAMVTTQILAQVLATFIVVGAITRLFTWRIAEFTVPSSVPASE